MPQPRLHILHVVLSLNPGGLERLVVSLCKRATEQGHRVSVLCLEESGTLAPEAVAAGARVYCLRKRLGLRLGLIRRIRALLTRLQPDVIHSHQIAALFYTGPAAKWARVPVIVHTEHGKHYSNQHWRKRLLGRCAAGFAQRVFCVSDDLVAELESNRIVSRSKVSCIPNGVDVELFAQSPSRTDVRERLAIPEQSPVIGTIGRLVEVKRQDVLIRGFAALHERVPSARLLIVGDGPLRSTLEQLARELHVADAVHFAGYQSRPQDYLSAMHVFTLTSRSEGMPLVVLEAWAAGVPVVASRVGGIPQLIRDGENGCMFEAGEAKQLANLLERVLNEPTSTQRMVETAKNEVRERYSLQSTADRYEQAYHELLSEKRGSHAMAIARGSINTIGHKAVFEEFEGVC